MKETNVIYINSMGNDQTVVDSARVSFNQDMVEGKTEYELDPSDQRLIKYLCSQTVDKASGWVGLE